MRTTRRRPNGNIFVYCGSAKHAQRAAVTNYAPDPHSVGWQEIPASHATRNPSVQTMVDDEPFEPRGHRDRKRRGEPVNSDAVRHRVRLECRRCKANVPIHDRAKLDAALDMLASVNQDEVSLSELSAILGLISTD